MSQLGCTPDFHFKSPEFNPKAVRVTFDEKSDSGVDFSSPADHNFTTAMQQA
jgi:hypothetical protein